MRRPYDVAPGTLDLALPTDMVEGLWSYDQHRRRTTNWRPQQLQDPYGRLSTMLRPHWSSYDHPILLSHYKISSSMACPSFSTFSSSQRIMQKRAMRVTRSDPRRNLCRSRVGRVQILGSGESHGEIEKTKKIL